MKLPYSWLIELTGLDWSPTDMADRLTMSGTYVEEIEPAGRFLDHVVVARVMSLSPVPDAKKLQLAEVTTGDEIFQVVCGAPNVAVGQLVPLALPGARMANGMTIAVGEIRGVRSQGMLCSESELGVSHDHAGIMVLESTLPVGTALREAIGFDDCILHFELTPNRGDSHSAIGIARDLVALAGSRLRRPDIHFTESGTPTAEHVSIRIENPDDTPRFTLRVIRNCTNGKSPWWLQRKLLLSGVRPISTLVDISNLVMLETGNPLHAFDFDRFNSPELLVRRAKSGERLTTLDGKDRTLSPDVLLITDGQRPRGAAGVMGGIDSEVNDSTRNVLLEAAFFNPSVIRKSRRSLDISSEASHRFERTVDFDNLHTASNRCASLIAELCSGQIAPGIAEAYPRPMKPSTIRFRPSFCNRILGTAYSPERMDQVLTSLGCRVSSSGEGEIKAVDVPSYRPDLTQEYDLFEEISRIEGYHTIPEATRTKGPLYTPLHRHDLQLEQIRSLLTGAGFDEIMGHGLAHSKKLNMLHPSEAMIKILNPVADDLDAMRNSLLANLLETVSHNVAHRNLSLRLFELGNVYLPDSDSKAREPLMLGLATCGVSPGNWKDKSRPLMLHDITGAIEIIANHYRLPPISHEADSSAWGETGSRFTLSVGGEVVGRVAQVATAMLRKFDIKQPVAVAEIDLARLLARADYLPAFEPLPVYPSAPRDLALVIDSATPAAEIVSVIRQSAGELASRVIVFDEYTGSQIPPGKRSLALTIDYRSPDRSLTGEEVEARQLEVIAALRGKLNAEVRDK